MAIVIDKTNVGNNYVSSFDTSFIDQLYLYLSDVTFVDGTSDDTDAKTLTKDLEDITVGDWVYIVNIDMFNALSLNTDLDIIITPSLTQIYESNYMKLLYYTVSIDYNPLATSQYAQQYMNILINLQEGLNDPDETQTFVGVKYNTQTYFNLSDPINCVVQPRPSAKGINQGKANYLRWEVDFIFLLVLDQNVSTCPTPP